MGLETNETTSMEESYLSFAMTLLHGVSSPVGISIALVLVIIIYKTFSERRATRPSPPPLPKMKKRDMTITELLEYDGTKGDGRVLVAINGKIFDVTERRKYYGPDGPYSAFGGHDASRALACFKVELVKDEYDDLSDLDSQQMDSVREWEQQFTDKYDYVGKLLRPGECATSYSEDEDDTN